MKMRKGMQGVVGDDGSGKYRLQIPLDQAFLLACAKEPPIFNALKMKVMEQKFLAICLWEMLRQNSQYPEAMKRQVMDALEKRWPDINWNTPGESLSE